MPIIGSPNAVGGAVNAGSIITIVRDLIPDPVYDSSGNALPSTDGNLLRAQTLYRFLNDAVKAVTIKSGWVLDDWTAVPFVAHVPHYDIPNAWSNFDEVFYKGWRLGKMDEGPLMWPQVNEATQGTVYALHSVTDHWNVRFYPSPSTSDPTTSLNGGIVATDTTLVVGNVTSFLPYGFLRIDQELLQYYNIATGTTTLSGLVRGVGGTIADAHADGAVVTHCSGWLKGLRLPRTITSELDTVEVPPSFQYPLQLYVLARCRQAENEFTEAARVMKEFNDECSQRLLDPLTKAHQGMAAKPYGEPIFGALAWGRVIIQ